MAEQRAATSIYDAIGGSGTIAVTVDDFYDRVLSDPELLGYFTGVDTRKLKTHQRRFLAAALGGGEGYQGRPLREAHAQLRIRLEHFDLVVAHLIGALSHQGVGEAVIDQIVVKLAPLKNEIAPPID
jgi:hemoglobin